MVSGYGKRSRPGARKLVSLLPDVKTETDADLAEAFIGRFMHADGGSAYATFAGPYCKSTGSYDVMNAALKNEYRRCVVNGSMDEMEFFRCVCWLLENMMQVNSYSMSKAARLYDIGRLPYGKIAQLKASVVDEITQVKGL